MSRRAWYVPPAGLALVLLVASCGGGGDSLASQSPDTAQALAAQPLAGTALSPGGAVPGSAVPGSAVPDTPAASTARAATAEAPAVSVPAGSGPEARADTRSAAAPRTTKAVESGGSGQAKKAAGTARQTSAQGSAAKPSAAGPAQAASGDFAGAAAAAARVSAADKAAYDATNGATDTGVTFDSIKLGSVNMHSMAAANMITAPVVRGNLATITSLNDRGGILGRRMTLVDCDSATGDTARGKACVKKLVERDKIFSLITGIDWSTASIHDDLKHYKLPYVGAWAYSQTEWQDPYMFPTHMSMIHEAMAGANWVKNVVKPKTYGLLCLTSPEMQLACDEVQRVLDPAGIELVHRAEVAISENTMSPFVVAMRAHNPDHIVHYVINPVTIAKFFLEAEQQGYWPTQGMSGNHLAAEVLGSVWGKFAAGRYWTNTTYKLWGTEFLATMNKYARGNKGSNHHIVQAGYTGINMLAQAARIVGPNLTREKLMAELGNGQVWKADASLDQKFSYRPSERTGQQWSRELGNGREFMYKYTGPNTVANPDGSPSGFAPDPGQFVIYTD